MKTYIYLFVHTPGGTEDVDNKSRGTTGAKLAGKKSAGRSAGKSQEAETEPEESGEEKGTCLSCARSLWG